MARVVGVTKYPGGENLKPRPKAGDLQKLFHDFIINIFGTRRDIGIFVVYNVVCGS